MNVTLRTHYSLNFHHRELVYIGFDEDILYRLYCCTSRRKRKFLVFWDNDNCVHFGESEYWSSREEDMNRSFYASLLTWCYHKTRIKCYRVIHRSNTIHLLFNHQQDDVNLRDALPEHDLTGLCANSLTRSDNSTNHSWKITQDKYGQGFGSAVSLATVRP